MGAEGVIIAQGANIGDWTLYAKAGQLKYCYNWGGLKHFYVESTTPIPAREHQVRMEFAYDGGGLGKGGTATLYIDGKLVGEGRIDATLAMIFSADDGCDVARIPVLRYPPAMARPETRSMGGSRASSLRLPSRLRTWTI